MNLLLERLRMTFMANVRYDHVTMFILYLPLAVFSFSFKSRSFALASKAGISLYSLFQENICRKRDSLSLYSLS